MADLPFSIPLDPNGRNVSLQYYWDLETLQWVKATIDSGSTPTDAPNVSGGGGTTYKTLIDEVSTSVTYVGDAPIGTATASASWRIKKIIESGTVTSILFADGNGNFDNVWDNRVSLSYS